MCWCGKSGLDVGAGVSDRVIVVAIVCVARAMWGRVGLDVGMEDSACVARVGCVWCHLERVPAV